MAPGPIWKSSVKQVDTALDKCRQHLDNLSKMDNVRQEIYRNPNTKVEVLVKTKKSNQDWASMLSEAERSINSDRPQQQKQKRPPAPAGPKKVKTEAEKRFAQSTKASKARMSASAVGGPKGNKDEVDDSSKKEAAAKSSGGRHQFSNRTLQIFLREMRLALKSEDAEATLGKILDDLEFVAANLDHKEVEVQHQQRPREDKSHLYDISLLKAEAKTVKADNQTLKR
jgi:hypothetical protein